MFSVCAPCDLGRLTGKHEIVIGKATGAKAYEHGTTGNHASYSQEET